MLYSSIVRDGEREGRKEKGNAVKQFKGDF